MTSIASGNSAKSRQHDTLSGMVRQIDTSTLQAALIGYEVQRQRIIDQIAALRRRLGTRDAVSVSGDGARRPKKRHIISPEGRARIAAAQKRRWAKAKKAA